MNSYPIYQPYMDTPVPDFKSHVENFKKFVESFQNNAEKLKMCFDPLIVKYPLNLHSQLWKMFVVLSFNEA